MMYALAILVFILLIFALLFSIVHSGKWGLFSKIFRWVVVLGSVAFFSWWFFKKSFSSFLENSLSVQVVNSLSQPIDFYTVKVSNGQKPSYDVNHLGLIRPGYYRIEYFTVQDSDEYWIMGFIGKKQLVYFSQHAVGKNAKEQNIEVRNYINQSQKLSDIGVKQMNDYLESTLLKGSGLVLIFSWF